MGPDKSSTPVTSRGPCHPTQHRERSPLAIHMRTRSMTESPSSHSRGRSQQPGHVVDDVGGLATSPRKGMSIWASSMVRGRTRLPMTSIVVARPRGSMASAKPSGRNRATLRDGSPNRPYADSGARATRPVRDAPERPTPSNASASGVRVALRMSPRLRIEQHDDPPARAEPTRQRGRGQERDRYGQDQSPGRTTARASRAHASVRTGRPAR